MPFGFFGGSTAGATFGGAGRDGAVGRTCVVEVGRGLSGVAAAPARGRLLFALPDATGGVKTAEPAAAPDGCPKLCAVVAGGELGAGLEVTSSLPSRCQGSLGAAPSLGMFIATQATPPRKVIATAAAKRPVMIANMLMPCFWAIGSRRIAGMECGSGASEPGSGGVLPCARPW